MPFYEYECPSCRYYLEVLQKITDRPLKKCPSCGKAGFKRLMSAPVFRLKGSGWYETDFKSEKDLKRNLAMAEREEAGDKAKGKGEGEEAKPAAPETGKAAEATPAAKPEASVTAEKPAARSTRSATPVRTRGTATPKPAAKRAQRAARPAKRRKGRR